MPFGLSTTSTPFICLPTLLGLHFLEQPLDLVALVERGIEGGRTPLERWRSFTRLVTSRRTKPFAASSPAFVLAFSSVGGRIIE